MMRIKDDADYLNNWSWPRMRCWTSQLAFQDDAQTRSQLSRRSCTLHSFPISFIRLLHPTSTGYYNGWSSPTLWDDETPDLEADTVFENNRLYYVISSSESNPPSDCTTSPPRYRSLSAVPYIDEPPSISATAIRYRTNMQHSELSNALPSTGGSGQSSTHSTVIRHLSKSEKKSLKRAKSGDALSKAITPAIAMEEAPTNTPTEHQESSDDSDRPISKRPFHQSHDNDHGTWEATKSAIEIEGVTAANDCKTKQWETTRVELRKQTCPVVRFRAERLWLGANTLYSISKQKQQGVHIITIRAIGTNAKHSNGCYPALIDALVSLGIKPVVIQQQLFHTEWPNEWIVHVPNEDALRLPSYASDSKGVLCNATGTPFFFSWNLIPRTSSEESNSEYRFLRFIAHTPAFGPLPDVDSLPFTTNLMVPNENKEDTTLHVSNVRFQGFQEDGWHYCSGDYVVTVNHIPTGNTFEKFWKSATNKIVLASWEKVPIQLTLANPCHFCGAEQHPNGKICEFKAVVDLLEDRRKKGKVFPNTRFDFLDDASHFERHPNDTKGKQREQTVKPSAPVNPKRFSRINKRGKP
ncbi:hypothetical protein PCASD_22487 [Puccinia coronata f. sp. avenae]|nr:hypothetical protein PCASD_22487 [Puccinia coronata f. sp. avenae]